MNEAQIRAENEAAFLLMRDLAFFINQRGGSTPVALLAIAKLLGQTCAFMDASNPEGMLAAALDVARDEMRLRALGMRLQAAGLGRIMPVRLA